LPLSAVEAYFADVVLWAYFLDALSGVRVPQDADLVFGRVSLAFHFRLVLPPD
jgi:hypothetical protein